MSLQAPLLLATLLVPLAALGVYLWLERRPARYAVSFPNLSVLGAVVRRGGSWRRTTGRRGTSRRAA